MFITPAFAQNAVAAGEPNMLTSLIPFILIFVIFYFLLIRPQQKRLKEHQLMVTNLRRGDRVVTGGGIIGSVSRIIDENEVALDIADGVTVNVIRSTISSVLSKPTPASKSETANDDTPKPASRKVKTSNKSSK
jgi:preprotein translocase subunit YajC